DGVWVANRLDGTVSKVDPARGAVAATIPVGAEPSALAINGRRVWVAVADGVRAIDGRRAIALGRPAGALAVAGGELWATTLAAAREHRGGTLHVAARAFGACACVDPVIAAWGPESVVLDLVYDGLLAYRRAGGAAGAELVADLATRVPRAGPDG